MRFTFIIEALEFIIEALEDFWYVRIKRLHKHEFKRIENASAGGFLLQRYQCPKCGNILGLDDWQIEELPKCMKYQSREEIEKDMTRKEYIIDKTLEFWND